MSYTPISKKQELENLLSGECRPAKAGDIPNSEGYDYRPLPQAISTEQFLETFNRNKRVDNTIKSLRDAEKEQDAASETNSVQRLLSELEGLARSHPNVSSHVHNSINNAKSALIQAANNPKALDIVRSDLEKAAKQLNDEAELNEDEAGIVTKVVTTVKNWCSKHILGNGKEHEHHKKQPHHVKLSAVGVSHHAYSHEREKYKLGELQPDLPMVDLRALEKEDSLRA